MRGRSAFWSKRGRSQSQTRPQSDIPGAVTRLSRCRVISATKLIIEATHYHAPPPQVKVPSGCFSLKPYTACGAGAKSDVSKGFQDACRFVDRNRSLHRLRLPRHVQRWYYHSGKGYGLANSVRCGQDGRRNCQGILRFMPSTEGGGWRRVRVDEELRSECLINDPNTSLSCNYLLFQQASDNVGSVKDIEQRVQSLSGVLASPASEDDYAEKARRIQLQRFGFIHMYVDLLIHLSGSLRGSSRSLNHSPTNMYLLVSCEMLTMPRC